MSNPETQVLIASHAPSETSATFAAPRPRGFASAAALLAGQLATFGLIVAFMRAEETWKLLTLGGLGVALGTLFASWGRLRSLTAAAYRDAPRVANVTFAILVLVIPVVFRTSPYVIHIFIISGLYAILALGLNFQLGSTGVVNLATAATYGIGAYTSALLSVHFQIPPAAGILIGGAVGAFFGLLLGFPCLRTKDYYLSLVTIAFGMIVYLLMNNLKFTGGADGVANIPPLAFGGYSFKEPINLFGLALPYQSNYFYFVALLLVLTTFVAVRLHHSRTGLVWNAIREDEIAARCNGIDVTRYKVLAFCIDAFFGGVCGTVYAHYVGFISPENFHFAVSIIVVTMVIFGGMDNVAGVILGAILLTVLPEKLRVFHDYRLMFYGAIVITLLVFRPQGLIPQRLRSYLS